MKSSLFRILGAIVIFVGILGLAWFWRSGESDEATVLTRDVCATEGASLESPLFNSELEDILLHDMSGDAVRLRSLGGRRASVLVFLAYSCPCSHGYVERLRALSTHYTARGISFVGIHSNGEETPTLMRRYLRETRYPFSVLRDKDHYLADRLMARVTPEVFVFDSSWTLYYHGRIDDDKGGMFVRDSSLRSALDTLLLGQALVTRDKPGGGCAISH